MRRSARDSGFLGFVPPAAHTVAGEKTIKQEDDNMIIRVISLMKNKDRVLCPSRTFGLFETRLFTAL
jgi:hypothetical protein